MLHTRVQGDHRQVVRVHNIVNVAGQAEGELVCFLDADDVLLPNALVEFMRLRKTKNCDIYAASFVEKTPSDCISKNAICTNGFFKNALKAICFHKITARMGNIVIKRDVLQSVGAMRTDITLYEDKEWLLRLFRGREVLASNYVVTICRDFPKP